MWSPQRFLLGSNQQVLCSSAIIVDQHVYAQQVAAGRKQLHRSFPGPLMPPISEGLQETLQVTQSRLGLCRPTGKFRHSRRSDANSYIHIPV